MPQFIVTISDAGLKAAEAAEGGACYSFQDWIQNAASEKERRSMDILISEKTNFNFKKISKAEKEEVIRGLTLETAKEKTQRLAKEMEEGST